MEEARHRKGDTWTLWSQIRGWLLWFGIPLVCWDIYNWWRHWGTLSAPNMEFELGDLLIRIAGDFAEATFAGLLFFVLVKLMRQRRLQKQGQIRATNGSD
jgi:hypothetical protein